MGIELALARKPDAIVMDVNLPGIDGFTALERLRAQPALASVPVIALTAAASERDRRRGLQAGFFRYLTKPVRVDELLAALQEILG
jgi:CheY-like chemotaxis protein